MLTNATSTGMAAQGFAGADAVHAVKAGGLDGLRGLYEVHVNGQMRLMTQQQLDAFVAGAGASNLHLGGGPGAVGGPAAQAPQPSFTVRQENGRTVIEGTKGRDDITIDQTKDGRLVISDGKGGSVTLDAQQSKNAIIRGGDGNDRIHATDRVTHDLTIDGGKGEDDILGGAGNDTLLGGDDDDRIRGGKGDDTIEGGDGHDDLRGGDGKDTIRGGRGNDYVEGGEGDDNLDGGEGCDFMYGLGGNDTMTGGIGHDYMDGGAGNDTLDGGEGDDALLGGKGDDTLRGGDGSDVLAGGSGKNSYDGGAGRDDIYHQKGEKPALVKSDGDRATVVDMSKTVGTALKVGRPLTEAAGHAGDFKARVESDIEALASLPESRGLLEALDKSKAKISVHETRADPQARNGDEVDYNTAFRSLAPAGAARTERWQWVGPTVAFYHELVHSHAFASNGTERGRTGGQCNEELATVGLPIKKDGDAQQPDQTSSRRFTENGLRQTLHMDLRPSYGEGEAEHLCPGEH